MSIPFDSIDNRLQLKLAALRYALRRSFSP